MRTQQFSRNGDAKSARRIVGLPRCHPPRGALPKGTSYEDWIVLYWETHKRHGDYARGCAERFRSLLANDLLTPGDAVSIAYRAVWELAGERLHRRVYGSERGYLATVIYRKTIREFKDELKEARPQAIVARDYAKGLQELEDEIEHRKAAESLMSDDEECKRRAELEKQLALSPHREYPEDDAASVASPRRALAERVVGGIAAADMVVRILAHPWMAEGTRQRYAFLQLLVHEGGKVDGEVWDEIGWPRETCRVLLCDVKTWVRATFPDARDLV